MPSYYPVYLNLEEQPCVVVGGGYEAERKVQDLLESGAQVTVISPEVTTILHDIADRGLIDWKRREYQPGDLEEAFLVVAENTEPRVYKEVACEAQQRRQLLNVVDVTHLCNFIAPAIVRREDVTFAISTSGLSPALARRLREELEDNPILKWADTVRLLSKVRLELRSKGVKPHPDRWQQCMDQEFLDMFHNGQQAQAKERLLRMLQEQPSVAAKDHT